MDYRRLRHLSLLVVFLIACGSQPKHTHADFIDQKVPKGISERFNAVGVDKVHEVKPLPKLKPIVPIQGKVEHDGLKPVRPELTFPQPVPINPRTGKIEHDAVKPIRPDVKPAAVIGHADTPIRPIPNHIVNPTRLPSRPIVA